MLSTDELYRLEEPFDGRYRLVRLLRAEGATCDIWLAADLKTIGNDDMYSNDESSAKLVAIKIFRPENATEKQIKLPKNCSVFEGMPYSVIPYNEGDYEEGSDEKPKKNRTILVVAISLFALLLLGGILFLTSRPGPQPKPQLYDYQQVVQMLCEKGSGPKGKHLLDSLVGTNDYQATFLLSRLYFDISDPRDTNFYEQKWSDMRNNCGINPDNKKAHEYLFKAFTLNNSDPALLYQLGYDYHAGQRRGCNRKTDYALWCYKKAEEVLTSGSYRNGERYLAIIRERMDKILSDNSESHSPVKPINP